jgi:hypothetical protein
MGALARDRNDRPSLDVLQSTLDDCSERWTEPEWPVPALSAYLEAQTQASASESQSSNDGPTRVVDTTRVDAGSDHLSGDRPISQSDELDPERAKSRG